MNTYSAFKLLVKVEKDIDLSNLKWQRFDLWPLLRQCIWVELISTNANDEYKRKKNIFLRLFKMLNTFICILHFKVNELHRRNSEKIFISRAGYLQNISNKYFDKIIDPLIFLLNGRNISAKYYISEIQRNLPMSYHGTVIPENFSFSQDDEAIAEHKDIVYQVANLIGLNNKYIWKKYTNNFNQFNSWYRRGISIFNNKEKLKEIYVACWYFPDMMGICAAASKLGIETVDIQHGKQGKFQGMYSGWTIIPNEGYDLMPDLFWCWGKPSCNHILKDSPNRRKHFPFIGGFPWLRYYKQYLISDNLANSGKLIRVLVTTQPPQGDNEERIPKFIVKFLLSLDLDNMHFTFRCHPNDLKGYKYCKNRLKLIKPELYSIDIGESNLYDVINHSTHHITAYSSCCYEADAFNVPTLLYGEEAKNIYSEEIESGVFSWTNCKASELELWLNKTGLNDRNKPYSYIAPMPEYASKAKYFYKLDQ